MADHNCEDEGDCTPREYDLPLDVYYAYQAVLEWRPKQRGNRIIQKLSSWLLSHARI
jgi:hypothetical protein